MAPAAFRTLFTALALSATLGIAAPKHALDQSRIRANYHEGEFEKVIMELEGFIKSGRKCSPAESLFVEKHLAVVYAANPGTRERGRYHMFRLLDKEGGSDLLDMFVGDEVDGVFAKVRKEYTLRTKSRKKEARPPKPVAPVARAPDAKKPAPAAAAMPASGNSRSGSWTSAFQSAPARKPAHAKTVLPASPARAPAPTTLSIENAWAAAYPPTAATLRPKRNPETSDAVPGDKPSAPGSHSDADSAAIAPAWKDPGLWIGGAAALAVVAFTLFYSGSENATPGKTYVVPATASK